jgi:hypothetical protein
VSPFSLPLTRLIHESLSDLMSFAFSRQPLERLVHTKFEGEWKFLRKALFAIPEERATKACIELALFLRLLDDKEDISDYLKQTSGRHFGRLVLKDGSEKRLRLRDVANKIIHAGDLEWDLAEEHKPVLICLSQDEQWSKAEIDVVAVAAFCGQLVS